MAKFFNKAKEVNVQLNYEEELLKRISYIDYKRGNMKNAIKYF